jgi:hypothetical protein
LDPAGGVSVVAGLTPTFLPLSLGAQLNTQEATELFCDKTGSLILGEKPAYGSNDISALYLKLREAMNEIAFLRQELDGRLKKINLVLSELL